MNKQILSEKEIQEIIKKGTKCATKSQKKINKWLEWGENWMNSKEGKETLFN